MYGESLDFQCQNLQTKYGTVLMTNLPQNVFSVHSFYVVITDADIGRLTFLRTLFDEYLDRMLVNLIKNRIVQNIQNFEHFRKKWLTIFEKRLTPFWKTFLGHKQCSSIAKY